MIHYTLRCDGGHEFEGWFRDSAAFETQSQSGLLSCPRCGSMHVDRGLMAPAVRTRRAGTPVAVDASQLVADEPSRPGGTLPDEMRATLQRLRSDVERNCEDLGDRFADEAIRMNRGEVETRGIYGNATADDKVALADEGIEIMQIPWLKPAES